MKIQHSLILGVLICLVACGEQEINESLNIRAVRTIVVDDDQTASLKTFSGVSRSAQESRLSFKVGGTIESVPVKAGDKISAGMIIASIDSSTYELQLQQAQATVEQSRAASRNAKAAYQRTRGLYANNNASLGDLDSARANADSASAQLRAANKALQLAELNLSYTNLTVDVDCAVDSIAIEVNENVSTSTEVARVNCSDELEIEIAVPESIIGRFFNGKQAEIKFDALPGQVLSGKVIEVGVGASGVGSTFPVTVLIDQGNELARPGLAAAVSFMTDQSNSDRHILPLSAIARQTDGTFVYLVTPSDNTDLATSESLDVGHVTRREIELGELQTGGIEIVTGLNMGDRVVVAGVSFMREGLLVSY